MHSQRDATQHSDDDGDGYGDNPQGTTPDSCLGIYGLSSEERYGCPDADGDGWENRLDAYVDDPLLWSDSDGDGYADQTGTNLSDDCPAMSLVLLPMMYAVASTRMAMGGLMNLINIQTMLRSILPLMIPATIRLFY